MKIEGVGQETGGNMNLILQVNELGWLLGATCSSPCAVHRRRVSNRSESISASGGGSSSFFCHDHSSEWRVAGLTMLGLPISCQIQPITYNSASEDTAILTNSGKVFYQSIFACVLTQFWKRYIRITFYGAPKNSCDKSKKGFVIN